MERYLGLPNVVGRRKKESFQYLKEKVHNRIEGWSTRMLSQGGKEVFLKAVLQAIPTYAMSCFLLPKSLCRDMESIFAKFWWQKAHGRRGIHWCQWKYLCRSKENGGLGFRDMAKFNISLLAKQGWRILSNPDSLLAQVLKAKYFPNVNFLYSRLESNASYTWKSIWAMKGILEEGLCWKVGKGTHISVGNDSWIPDVNKSKLLDLAMNLNDVKFADLINQNNRTWKKELIFSTFPEDVAEKIICIPLAEEPHDDF
ncbi:uncharacterized mitochondrial protein AtMg00310-like [Gossypium raimondii]|uniref:uncharacterized mitochondrial protein AtMg00310-like n=1 Tax=Gossypium raimondii TaxID=29730 RepID=UPI00227A1F11|nr:uncharacterized mitochondrial protein AtMg00310-like [Gossypium raimondii]